MSYQLEKLVVLAVELLRQKPHQTADEVSAKLGVHRHTLQRALKARDRTFASIKQSIVLERFYCHLAHQRAAPLKELWTGLGFASASAFARYVRRATSKSPTEHRNGSILGHCERKNSKMHLDEQAGIANTKF